MKQRHETKTGPSDGHADPYLRPASLPLRAPGADVPGEPLVSVVMTSFNSSAWLRESIASMLAQDWDRLELVLVDDASQDDSVAIALQAAARDPRVRVLAMQRNAGTYVARNAGIRASRGEVVTFCDSDDRCTPDRIGKQLAQLRAPGIVASTCNYVRVDASGEVVMNRGLRERQGLVTLMVRREVFDDIGWFDAVRTSADDEFFERLRLVYGRPAHANVAEPLYLALHRHDSLSTARATGANLSDAGEAFLSPPRQHYVQAYKAWHAGAVASGQRPYMPLQVRGQRPFPVDPALLEPGGSKP